MNTPTTTTTGGAAAAVLDHRDRAGDGPVAQALDARSLYRFFRAGDEETLALRGVSLTVAAAAAPTATGSPAAADPAAATDRSAASQPTTPAVDSSAAAALSPVNAGQPTCA